MHYLDPIMNRIGATVVWPRQIDYLLDTVVNRMHGLTEFDESCFLHGLTTWYRKHAMLLDWELEGLYRIKTYISQLQPVEPWVPPDWIADKMDKTKRPAG